VEILVEGIFSYMLAAIVQSAGVVKMKISRCFIYENKKLSWCLSNQRDAFRGQSWSPNIVPYHNVRYSFLLVWNSNFVFRARRFTDIRLQKCRDLENQVRGPSRSLEISPFDRAHLTSYWRSIVTMALSRVVSETFNEKKVVTMKSGSKVTQGHRSGHVLIRHRWFPINVP